MTDVSNDIIKFYDVPKIAYKVKDISKILSISERAASRLLVKQEFPSILAVRQKLVPIAPFNVWLKKNYPKKHINELPISPMDLKGKKSYSVPAIRKMLGIGKTGSYELIKSDDFEVVLIGGHIRITKESIDKWFHSQDPLHTNKE